MTPTHWQPLAVILGAAVGGAAGTRAAYAAKVVGAERYDRRHVLTVASGATAGAMIGARFGIGLELAAYLLLVAVAVPLSAIDIATRKVPDRILLPAVPSAIALLALAARSAGTYGPLGRALLAGGAMLVAYVALALATGSLGLGDCKAAGFCGIFLGYLGWNAAALGALAAFLLAAAVSVAKMARSGPARDTMLAFAPYIFAGALVVVVTS